MGLSRIEKTKPVKKAVRGIQLQLDAVGIIRAVVGNLVCRRKGYIFHDRRGEPAIHQFEQAVIRTAVGKASAISPRLGRT